MLIAEHWQDRSTWSTTGHCPIEKAMALLGSRAAMLLMREAYYGTRRFDDFVARVDVAPATAAAHLRALTEARLLARRPYRPAEGGRTREEYVLTEAGADLFPVLVGLFEWGRRHTDAPRVLELGHAGCGAPVSVTVTCAEGHHLTSDEVELRPRARQRAGAPAASTPPPTTQHRHTTTDDAAESRS